MFTWLHSFEPNPVLLDLSFIKIYWYGFLIAIGAILGFLIVLSLAKKYEIRKDDIYNLAFYVIIFGLIGDRLYYVFYAWDYYSQNLLDIVKIWQGGLAIHGAIIAGIIVVLIFAKKREINPWKLTDIIVVSLALAMAIGRWGNYFNMELFGSPTDLPWGIPIDPAKRPSQFSTSYYFHPTFLYESLWNLGIFIYLFIWHKIRLYKNIPEKIKGYGNITLAYLILYSIGRGLNEFLRIDYSPYVFGIRWAQIMSMIIIFICFIIIIVKIIKKSRTKQVSADSAS